jgi:hypothetical protein
MSSNTPDDSTRPATFAELRMLARYVAIIAFAMAGCVGLLMALIFVHN